MGRFLLNGLSHECRRCWIIGDWRYPDHDRPQTLDPRNRNTRVTGRKRVAGERTCQAGRFHCTKNLFRRSATHARRARCTYGMAPMARCKGRFTQDDASIFTIVLLRSSQAPPDGRMLTVHSRTGSRLTHTSLSPAPGHGSLQRLSDLALR